jgi:hypothetical protein
VAKFSLDEIVFNDVCSSFELYNSGTNYQRKSNGRRWKTCGRRYYKGKGSNVGTVANNDGEYTLSNVAKNTVFVISSIGYLPAEINIGTRTFVEIVLSADTRELGEVIVVGYGTQKKRDITGAVVSYLRKPSKKYLHPTC